MVAKEVARIDREFEGAVNSIVVPDSKFEAVFGILNVSFRSRGGRDPVVMLIHVHSFLPDLSGHSRLDGSHRCTKVRCVRSGGGA